MTTRLLNPLFFFIANATHSELARQIQYLKAENQILRARLPKRIRVTTAEREQLIRFARPVGRAVRALATIVSPNTLLRWLNGEHTAPKRRRRPGRPRTPEAWEQLILRLARETGWGYTRLLGELRKLGFRGCRSTVKNILDRHGHSPRSTHRDGTWDEFIRSHAESLWACDFFEKKVWTAKGLRTFYVLFALHIESRKVRIVGYTRRRGSAWMAQQARVIRDTMGAPPCTLMCDGDAKFTRKFERTLRAAGHHLMRLTPYSPNLNGHAERWVQSVKRECLDHFVVFGERHLAYLLREYEDYYNHRRPHSGIQHKPPEPPVGPVRCTGEVMCEQRLGGVIRHYYRHAA